MKPYVGLEPLGSNERVAVTGALQHLPATGLDHRAQAVGHALHNLQTPRW